MPRPRPKRTKRIPTTVHLDPELHQAGKYRAVSTGESLSDQVNEALRLRYREDEEALRLLRERRHQPTRPYEAVLADMKRRGLL